LLINKTSSTHEVSLAFDGFDPNGKKLDVTSAGPAGASDDRATSVSYNGANDPLPAALPAAASSTNSADKPTYSVPAYSLAVLSFGP
jgi:hypothetical protein